MDGIDELVVGSTEDWLSTLPDYQRRLLEPLVQGGDLANAATTWLNSAGPGDNASYGGVRAGLNLFYLKLLEQIRKLVCTSDGYADERPELLRQAQAGRSALITFIAGAVAPHVGASPALLAPAVALTLAILGNASSEAACATLDELIRTRSGEPT